MRRITGTRFIWLSGVEVRRRGLHLTRNMRQPGMDMMDISAYDKRRVKRALRGAAGRIHD